MRSGTSIGANIREAFYAHGKADFIAKLQIALKECSENDMKYRRFVRNNLFPEIITKVFSEMSTENDF